jgi:hypothetical protein
MSRSNKKGHDHVCRRRSGVLGRSRAEHATLPASLSGLAYVPVEAEVQR